MKYRPEIDGPRAISVTAVILFHAGIAGFAGGFVGVDVFFVISGFLITQILIGEIGAGGFSIARFYERRARRILPALYLVLAVSGLVAVWLLLPSSLLEFARGAMATLLFCSNVWFWWRGSDYFSPDTERDPLLHTWNLGSRSSSISSSRCFRCCSGVWGAPALSSGSSGSRCSASGSPKSAGG